MQSHRHLRRIMFYLCSALVLSFPLHCLAQSRGDWPMYSHDDQSSRFSPLTQINASNVSRLERAWTFHMIPPGEKPAPANSLLARLRRRRSETTPIMVDGILYLPTPYSRVISLNAQTGKEVWEYKLANGANASTRGVAYWPGDRKRKLGPRIVFGTSVGQLIALDAHTGKPVASFGEQGIVDIKKGVMNGFSDARFGMTSPPEIYKDVILTGAQVQESPSLGPSGDTRGWDAITGKLLWQFHSAPRPGEQGIETWETPGSWKDRSGINVWGFMSVDRSTGDVFLPYGNATVDAYGGDRAGANLYADTLLVLDAETGKQKWHFQAVHHDTWDYDLESAPLLVTVHRDGKAIPAVVLTSKTGLIFILDRRDGTPIYGVEERPVPSSDVPGEHAFKTEPWPLKPPPLARMSFQKSDLATVTPELEKYCQTLLNYNGGMHNDGPFTRYGMKPSLVFPGTLGATNWHGGSYDPQLNYVFYNIVNIGDIGQMVPNPPGSSLAYRRSGPNGSPYARFWDGEKFLPCQQPPWGQLVALNVDTGEYAWRVPLGVIPELEAKGIHNTGTLNMGGSIATAAGLVFIAATNDHHFRAFDAKAGKVLWDTKLEAGAYATPITYRGKDGKQYVVIEATGGGYYDHSGGDSVAAYALP